MTKSPGLLVCSATLVRGGPGVESDWYVPADEVELREGRIPEMGLPGTIDMSDGKACRDGGSKLSSDIGRSGRGLLS